MSSGRSLRIGLLGPVWFPIPPTGYGGIEWVVAILADSLVEAGHDVTLFASGDSRTKAKLVSVYDEAPSELIGSSLTELRHAMTCYERARDFDVLNDHSGLPAAALAGTVETPVVHTVHGPLDGEAGLVYEQIARVSRGLGLISLSLNQRRPRPGASVDRELPERDRPRRLPCRRRRTGTTSSSSAASRSTRAVTERSRSRGQPECRSRSRARCASRSRRSTSRRWCARTSAGAWSTSERSRTRRRSRLLQHARATLFPISWEEPFGLVMIESMACGTPVIATRFGAVPEVIEHGRGGLIVDDHLEMVDAIAEADRLDRAECRRSVEERFSPRRMVGGLPGRVRAGDRPRPVSPLAHAFGEPHRGWRRP